MLNKLTSNLSELKEKIGDKKNNKIDFDQSERIIKRIVSFSEECEECNGYTEELNEHIEKLRSIKGDIQKGSFKEYNGKIQEISSHLQKEHELIPTSYYLSIFLTIGMSIGTVIGLLLFDNIAIGSGLGMSIGTTVGILKDEDAKKKGLTI